MAKRPRAVTGPSRGPAVNPLYVAAAFVVAGLLVGIGWLATEEPPTAVEGAPGRVELSLAEPPQAEVPLERPDAGMEAGSLGVETETEAVVGVPVVGAGSPEAPAPDEAAAPAPPPAEGGEPVATEPTATAPAKSAPAPAEEEPAAPPEEPAAVAAKAPAEALPAPQAALEEASAPEGPAASAAVEEPGALPAPAPAAPAPSLPALETKPEPVQGAEERSEPALPSGAAEGLVEEGPNGPLPVIAADGRQPWQVYARPFDASDARPKIAILLTGLGLSQAATNAAIGLPGAVTLSFAPYATNLPGWAALARAAGHELFLDLPMEPANYPTDDPGPHTLLTSLNPDDNEARLDWLLSRFAGYVGVVDVMGTKFARSTDAVRPVLGALKRRGLMVLDSRTVEDSVIAGLAGQMGLPNAAADLFLDDVAARRPIDEGLARLEQEAKADGFAIAIARPYPVTLARLTEWARDLEERGFVLVPVSGAARGGT